MKARLKLEILVEAFHAEDKLTSPPPPPSYFCTKYKLTGVPTFPHGVRGQSVARHGGGRSFGAFEEGWKQDRLGGLRADSCLQVLYGMEWKAMGGDPVLFLFAFLLQRQSLELPHCLLSPSSSSLPSSSILHRVAICWTGGLCCFPI